MKRHQDICWLCHLEHAPDNRILTILFINPFSKRRIWLGLCELCVSFLGKEAKINLSAIPRHREAMQRFIDKNKTWKEKKKPL